MGALHVDIGVHLPVMPFGEEPLSLRRLRTAVDTASGCGLLRSPPTTTSFLALLA